MNIAPGSALLPPGDNRIATLEAYFKHRFPDTYRRFLERANGTIPVERTAKFAGEEAVVGRFLPILEDPRSDPANGWADLSVVASQLDARLVEDEEATGIALIPIAALFGGDLAVLDYCTSSDRPGIVR